MSAHQINYFRNIIFQKNIFYLFLHYVEIIIICMLTGLVLLSTGVWNEKIHNEFQQADMVILEGSYTDGDQAGRELLVAHLQGDTTLTLYAGELLIEHGSIPGHITVINARSIAENITVFSGGEPYTGTLPVEEGKLRDEEGIFTVEGESLMHSAQLTTEAFTRSVMGGGGKYIVSIGLLLFAFSTAISWSYYGDRAVTYLFGTRYVILYRLVYVVAFFFAAFTDTTIVWALSYITIAIMTIPNLVGILILSPEIKSTIKQYWVDFRQDWPGVKLPE